MSASILVIEDNQANMELMAYLLKARGHELIYAGDGVSGLAAAVRNIPESVPELIICDVQLPRLDGYGVIKALKQHPVLQYIPTIAVTAFAMAGDREKLLTAGFDGYISKPIEPESFALEIESFLPGKHERQLQQ